MPTTVLEEKGWTVETVYPWQRFDFVPFRAPNVTYFLSRKAKFSLGGHWILFSMDIMDLKSRITHNVTVTSSEVEGSVNYDRFNIKAFRREFGLVELRIPELVSLAYSLPRSGQELSGCP